MTLTRITRHTYLYFMQERAAWEGVAEELLRKDPAAAARFEKLAEAERRVSELMVPLPSPAGPRITRHWPPFFPLHVGSSVAAGYNRGFKVAMRRDLYRVSSSAARAPSLMLCVSVLYRGTFTCPFMVAKKVGASRFVNPDIASLVSPPRGIIGSSQVGRTSHCLLSRARELSWRRSSRGRSGRPPRKRRCRSGSRRSARLSAERNTTFSRRRWQSRKPRSGCSPPSWRGCGSAATHAR